MKSILTIIFLFLFIASGFSQTRNVVIGTNNVIVQPTNFWSANASNGRTGLGLGSAATNPASAFQPASTVLSNLSSSNGSSLTNLNISNITGTIPIASGGTGATNASIARANLNLGWPALTNSNSATLLLGVNTNGQLIYGLTNILTITNDVINIPSIGYNDNKAVFSTEEQNIQSRTTTNNDRIIMQWGYDTNGLGLAFHTQLEWQSPQLAAITRTNLGIGWSALTNTNAGTSLVSVNTNGEVVSPTNFWQVAPIQTAVQTFTPVTNSTNNGTNARNLYVYSLNTNVSGITNVVVLPTNSATFVGDNATVVHRGTTSSVTAIRQAGASTNLITISNYDDAIKFIHENGTWDFYHNISFVEPIKFTDGNLEFNRATSRTNLGIPLAALTNTNNAGFQRAIFQTNTTPASAANLSDVKAWLEISAITNGVTNSFRIPLFQ